MLEHIQGCTMCAPLKLSSLCRKIMLIQLSKEDISSAAKCFLNIYEVFYLKIPYFISIHSPRFNSVEMFKSIACEICVGLRASFRRENERTESDKSFFDGKVDEN